MILVIDRDHKQVLALKLLIQLAFPECQVLMTGNGKTGLEIAEKADPDMIFLDINMVDYDGFDIGRQLKNKKYLADIPIIFMLEYPREKKQVLQALSGSGDGIISKLIDINELVAQILIMCKFKNINRMKFKKIEQLEERLRKRNQSLKTSHRQMIDLFKSLEIEYKERKRSERALLEAQQIAHLGNYELNLSMDEITCSEEALKLMGIQSVSKMGSMDEIIDLIYQADHAKVVESIEKAKTDKVNIDFVFRIIRSNGEFGFVNARMSPRFDKDKNHTGYFGIIQDITQSRKVEEKIRKLSFYDDLTGLYNRRYYEEAKKNLDQPENYPLTVITADINGLKMINDSFGHVAGDELLKKATYVFKNSCREKDLIARMGGDEFMILLPKTDEVTAIQIVEQMEILATRE